MTLQDKETIQRALGIIEDLQKALWYLKKFLELEGVCHD